MPAPGAAIPRRVQCGRSAVGSASPCQGEGRGFESRRPLGILKDPLLRRNSPEPRWSGREARQRPAKPSTRFKSVSTSQQAARPYDQVMRTQARPRTCSAVRLAHLPMTRRGSPVQIWAGALTQRYGRPNGSAVLCFNKGPDLGGGRNAPDGSGRCTHTRRSAQRVGRFLVLARSS